MAGSFSIQRENLKVYQNARGMVISMRGFPNLIDSAFYLPFIAEQAA
jgi:hypothetical protein